MNVLVTALLAGAASIPLCAAEFRNLGFEEGIPLDWPAAWWPDQSRLVPGWVVGSGDESMAYDMTPEVFGRPLIFDAKGRSAPGL